MLLRILIAAICFSLGVGAVFCWFTFSPSDYVDVRDMPLPKVDPYQMGKEQAAFDISRGHLKIKTSGLAVVWNGPDLYKERLRKGYGIEVEVIGGCLITEEAEENSRGYNEVAMGEIERRFGVGLLERVNEQAVKEWKERQQAKSRSGIGKST